MLSPRSDSKIYLFTGYTDMRKGAASLAMLASEILDLDLKGSKIFIFRGKRADKLKILWWDQGFCLFYKSFDKGKFMWPTTKERQSVGITRAQLSMLLEGIDWRTPKWSEPPEYMG
jgi:transposase